MGLEEVGFISTIESFQVKSKTRRLTHLQYADIYDGPVIYKSGGITGWGIYEGAQLILCNYKFHLWK